MKRSVKSKVESIKVAFKQINVEVAAREAGVPASTLRDNLKKVENALPEILANRKPGPKPLSNQVEKSQTDPVDYEEIESCRRCGGKIIKNGKESVLNWLLMLMLGWLGCQRVAIQRYKCQECRIEIISPERLSQASARLAWWSQVARLVSSSSL